VLNFGRGSREGDEKLVPLMEGENQGSTAMLADISIFMDPIFVLFAVSNFCTSIGFNIPYVYIVVRILFITTISEGPVQPS